MKPGTDHIIDWQLLSTSIQQGDIRALARTISLVENEVDGYMGLMQSLPFNDQAKITGITGPPGAGKSTIVDLLIGKLVKEGKKVAVMCVDPSSPFHFGSLLGDRIRMSEWYNHPDVFIRSLATRGSLGGLHPHIIEITDLLKGAGFDHIIVETVGVGQSEVEIAGLAATTIVVLVPEAGDEIQTMKAGLMEIADIFVVNKADRPDAERFVKHLQQILAPGLTGHGKKIPVIKTVASQNEGIDELATLVAKHLPDNMDKKTWLLTEKALQVIVSKKMKTVDKKVLASKIREGLAGGNFNLYKLADSMLE